MVLTGTVEEILNVDPVQHTYSCKVGPLGIPGTLSPFGPFPRRSRTPSPEVFPSRCRPPAETPAPGRGNEPQTFRSASSCSRSLGDRRPPEVGAGAGLRKLASAGGKVPAVPLQSHSRCPGPGDPKVSASSPQTHSLTENKCAPPPRRMFGYRSPSPSAKGKGTRGGDAFCLGWRWGFGLWSVLSPPPQR